MEDRLETKVEKQRDIRGYFREETIKQGKRVPLSCINKQQEYEPTAIGEPASKAHRVTTLGPLKDRTNIDECEGKRHFMEIETTDQAPSHQEDCTEDSEMKQEILSKIEDGEEAKLKRRPEQYVQDLQAEIFDHCMRTEVVFFYRR